MPGGNLPSGSFYVDPDEYDDLFELYTKQVFVNKIPTHLTEAPDPNGHSPVKGDVDLRYTDTKPERRYTFDQVKQISVNYFKTFQEWLIGPLREEEKLCFLFEKTKASFKDKKKNQVIKPGQPRTVKDGIHYIFPYVVGSFLWQRKVRENVIKMTKEQKILESIELSNPLSDVFDLAVIEKNNWLMYGSSKPKKEPYVLTHILKYDEETGTVEDIDIDREYYTDEFLVKLLSMRNREDNRVTFKKEKEALLNDEKKKEELVKAEKQKAIAYNQDPPKKKKLNDEELELICEIIDILDPSRANSYDKWVQLIWCCHNIHNADDRLLKKVIEFSKQSPEYADTAEDECIKFWNKAKNDGLGEGSLRMWAKMDNPKGYSDLMKKSVWGYIKLAAVNENFNPWDIAQILHKLFEDNYICVNDKKGLWFAFTNNKWNELESPVELKELFQQHYLTTFIILLLLSF